MSELERTRLDAFECVWAELREVKSYKVMRVKSFSESTSVWNPHAYALLHSCSFEGIR